MYPEDLDIITVGQKSKAPLVQGTVPSRKAKVSQVERVMFFCFVSWFSKKTLGKIGWNGQSVVVRVNETSIDFPLGTWKYALLTRNHKILYDYSPWNSQIALKIAHAKRKQSSSNHRKVRFAIQELGNDYRKHFQVGIFPMFHRSLRNIASQSSFEEVVRWQKVVLWKNVLNMVDTTSDIMTDGSCHP